jgi:hypothetical protein
MKLKRIILITTCAFLLSIGAASAVEQPETKPRANTVAAERTAPRFGFGSGTGIGPGGAPGSASSLAGGFSSLIGNSGAGSQAFGGGFGLQPSANPLTGAGGSPLGRN